jgi:hypothetical protein
MNHMLFGRLLILLGLSVLTGCRNSNEPALSPVSGAVTQEGKPLAGVQVRFIPQGVTQGHGGAGTTDAEGKYEIIAHRSNNRKGLLPGTYKVVLTRRLLPDGSPLPPNTPPINSGARETIPKPWSFTALAF